MNKNNPKTTCLGCFGTPTTCKFGCYKQGRNDFKCTGDWRCFVPAVLCQNATEKCLDKFALSNKLKWTNEQRKSWCHQTCESFPWMGDPCGAVDMNFYINHLRRFKVNIFIVGRVEVTMRVVAQRSVTAITAEFRIHKPNNFHILATSVPAISQVRAPRVGAVWGEADRLLTGGFHDQLTSSIRTAVDSHWQVFPILHSNRHVAVAFQGWNLHKFKANVQEYSNTSARLYYWVVCMEEKVFDLMCLWFRPPLWILAGSPSGGGHLFYPLGCKSITMARWSQCFVTRQTVVVVRARSQNRGG